MRIVLGLLSAVAAATALDISFSLYRGYILRTDMVMLVVIDLMMMAIIAAPTLGLLYATRWVPGIPSLLDSAPRASILLAAWAAVSLPRLRRLTDPSSLLPEILLLLLIAVFVVVEGRKPRRSPGRRSAALILMASVLTIWAAVRMPLPGREMLQEPSGMPGAEASATAPNLLLIVLDTLRQDYLGLYGHAPSTSPFLDRFAKSSTVFEWAVSASAWTLPAHATLFTGLYPRSHGADVVEGSGGIDVSQVARLKDPMNVRPLAEQARTLAEIARDQGMETAAICGNVAYLYNIFGLDQGFETYVDEVGIRPDWVPAGFRLADVMGLWRFWPYRRAVYRNQQNDRHAGEITRLALEWLKPRRDERFTLFLNYIDAHDPYFPPWSYARRFPMADKPAQIDRNAILAGERDIGMEEAAPSLAAYAAEIRYMDDQLAVLFRRLEEWDLMDRTLVVIVGDHGESFGEHHDFRHGNNVYENEIRVPLIVRQPEQKEGQRIERIVHLVDVMPTILDILHLDRPSALQGNGLFAVDPKHPIVAFTASSPGLGKTYPRYARDHHAIYQNPWKLIAHSDGEVELYDLAEDPRELVNQADLQPELVTFLGRELERFKDEVRPRFQAPAAELDEETIRRLKALGYLE